jgi:hypothetical protein
MPVEPNQTEETVDTVEEDDEIAWCVQCNEKPAVEDGFCEDCGGRIFKFGDN